jgi:hypothetical protein
MQISGDYSLPISFQSGIDSSFDCVFGSGIYQFGLTGLSGGVDFYVSGSRIFDSRRKFIYSAPYNQTVNLQILVDSSTASFVADGELLSSSTGNFSPVTGFFSKSNEYYENTPFFSGEKPILQYVGVNNFDSGVDTITGLLVNLTPYRQFRIKNIVVSENSIGLTSISGWQTGNIENSGKIYITSLLPEAERTGILKTKLETNFGTTDLNINLGTNATDENEKLNLWPDETLFRETESKTYLLETEFNFGSRFLDVRLEYISGGQQYPYYLGVTGIGTGYYTGDIIRFGNITGAISGMLPHSVYVIEPVEDSVILTGIVTGNATGDLQGLYSGQTIEQTGVLSGYNVTLTSGDYGYHYFGVGTGAITGIYSHVTGSGALSFSLSGSASNWSGGVVNTNSGLTQLEGLFYKIVFPTPLTGFDYVFTTITHPDLADIYVANQSLDFYYSGTIGPKEVYTGYIGYANLETSGLFTFSSDYTGALDSLTIYPRIWQNLSVVATGTGNFGEIELTSGYYSTFTGGLTGEKLIETGVVPFTGMWNLATGKYYPNIFDFRSHGWGNTGEYFHTGAPAILPEKNTTSIIEVSYDGSNTSGVNSAKLKYSDGYLSGELLISGVGKEI